MPKGANPKDFAKPFNPPTAHRPPKAMGGYIPPGSKPISMGEEDDDDPIPVGGTPGPSRIAAPFKPPGTKAIPASSFYATKAQAGPAGGEKIVIGEKSNKDRLAWGGALHDPQAEGAVVMTRPKEEIAKAK